jgi:hypothetical protein
MERTPITHKKCRRCKEVKHRRNFIPLLGLEFVRYDSYCSACRNTNFYIPPNILDQRVKDGLLRPARREKIKERMVRNKADNVVRVLKKHRANQKKASWALAEKSLARCRIVMAAHVFQKGCAGWCVEVHKLIHRAEAYIKQEKKKRHLATNAVVFWYDVGEFVDAYRSLIKAYPLGENQCPLQIF